MHPPKEPDRFLLLDGTVFRPNDDLRHPVAVINHGMPFDGDFRALDRCRFSAASDWFVQNGWVVAVPMRRGYASSEGECVEGTGGSENPDFYLAGQSTANDIVSVVALSREMFYDFSTKWRLARASFRTGALMNQDVPPDRLQAKDERWTFVRERILEKSFHAAFEQ